MTRLLLCSDMHTNFHRDAGRSAINSLYDTDVDIVVVAGDLSVIINNMLQDNIKMLCDKFPQVVFVTGNHSYYHGSFIQVDSIIAGLESKLSNFTWLNDTRVIVSGVPFIGGTLWFPNSPAAQNNKSLLNDYYCIKDFEPEVYNRHNATVTFLENNTQEGDVMVTHHMPTRKSVAPKFAKSNLNCFFACDLDEMIKNKKPAFVLHAHTHSSCDYLYHSSRVICNPMGYPNQINPAFDSSLVLTI